jgi:hypothetical protein
MPLAASSLEAFCHSFKLVAEGGQCVPLSYCLTFNAPRLCRQALHSFIRTNNAQLFGNVAMKTVLEYKWKAYARQLFMRELLLFGVALTLFTAFTLLSAGVGAEESLHDVATAHGFSGVAMIILALLLPISSVRQLTLEYRQVRPALALTLSSFSLLLFAAHPCACRAPLSLMPR